MRIVFLLMLLLASVITVAGREQTRSIDLLYAGYDELLDLYVRDGFVYYNALKSDRSRLDRFLAEVGSTTMTNRSSPEQQRAFWINAYNAFVLRTVIDYFPIRGKSSEYPPDSIRQIPGAFDKRTHRAAGKMVTLDGIEKDILMPLGDPRVFLALGRGSAGGGRLRSEAYDPAKLETQLEAVAGEAITRRVLVKMDFETAQLSLSPIFSWRESAFVTLADKAHAVFNQRSPLERAVLAIIEPHLVRAEAEFLEKNQFRTVFHTFDWRLNDLSSRTQD
jgi:hypothetical protein